MSLNLWVMRCFSCLTEAYHRTPKRFQLLLYCKSQFRGLEPVHLHVAHSLLQELGLRRNLFSRGAQLAMMVEQEELAIPHQGRRKVDRN